MLLSLFLLICIFLCAACDGPKAAPYDERKSEALTRASAMLREQRYDEAIALLQATGPGEYHSLLELLHAQQNDLALLRQANALLLKGDYNELIALIEKAERRGEASPQLLQYRSLPQALQALQLFCRKRPWESAADLETAMHWLQPYLPVLQESAVFRDFWQQQEREKQALLEAEKRAGDAELIRQIDWELANFNEEAAWQAVQKFQQKNPTHELFSMLDVPKQRLAREFAKSLSAGTKPGLLVELALLLNLSHGDATLQRAVKKHFDAPKLEPPMSLAGLIAAARINDDPALYSAAYTQWLSRNSDKRKKPAFLVELLDSFFSRAEQFNARCWRTPCPGLTDWFDRINQIAVNASMQTTKETP
ncbi:MAG: hypothetical protein GX946_10395 [Oligosphaeraceae bacterium]|nr:hypothetical protein [Oligosphaeraceae bacterium]